MTSRHYPRGCPSVDMEPMDDSSDNSNQTWLQDGINSMQLKRSEMNELIMDYLVHEGFKEAAERFREEAGIEPLNLRLSPGVPEISDQSSTNQGPETSATTTNNGANIRITGDSSHSGNGNNNIDNKDNSISSATRSNQKNISNQASANMETDEKYTKLNDLLTKAETPDMMDKRVEVRHLIEEGDILRAQSLINLYYPELLDNHRELYFKLQQQHLIELIRKQKINDVLSYVHEQLSVDELRDLTEMERTLALLAYENPDRSPYASLLRASHRLQLASEINDIILQETSGSVEPTKPRLVTLLKLLFWSQNELERKKIPFPKMTDLVDGTILEPRLSDWTKEALGN